MRYLLISSIFLLSISISGCWGDRRLDGNVKYANFNLSAVIKDQSILKPADIISYKDGYVYAELLENTIGYFRLPLSSDSRVGKFNPKSIDQRFVSPHFMATDGQRIFLSNGWGSSVVSIDNLNGDGFKEIGIVSGKQLSAPHGLCVSNDGFLYIGDSLNSRIVRVEISNPENQSVFPDQNKLVSYSRQLICSGSEVWVSNSYENRPSLNKGSGSNVLRIKDWNKGLVDVVFEHPNTNITGIALIDKTLVVGLWSSELSVIAKNLLTKESYYVNHRDDNLGIPYGMFYDPGNQRLLVSYLGTLDKKSTGGFVVFEVKKSDVLNVTHAKYELPKKCDWMILCELKDVFQKFNHAWGWLAMRLGS